MFLGNPSARIREILWEKAVEKAKDGYVLQIWDHPCSQGYKWRSYGKSSYAMIDMEGIALIKKNKKTV